VIVILIGWLIAGILLVALSGLMYYYNTIGLLGFTIILLLSIVIVLASTLHFVSWHRKWKASIKPYSEALKTMFTLIAVISIIIFLLGVVGYLFSAMGIFKLDPQTTNTLLTLLTVGLLSTLGSIISWVYVERSAPGAISRAITEQQRILNQLKDRSEAIGTDIRSKDSDMKKSIEDAIRIENKNKEVLKR